MAHLHNLLFLLIDTGFWKEAYNVSLLHPALAYDKELGRAFSSHLSSTYSASYARITISPLRRLTFWVDCGLKVFKLAFINVIASKLDKNAEYLLSVGSFNPTEFLALSVASENILIVKLLIQNGADVNVIVRQDVTPLTAAIELSNFTLVQLLLEHGALVNNSSYLMLAGRHASSDIVDILIKKGADVNFFDVTGKTALFKAIKYGTFETVKVLVDNGADVNKRYFTQQSVLMYAAQYASPQILKLLIDNGADVTAKDRNHYSVLIHAVYGCQLENVKFLLKNYIDIFAEDSCFYKAFEMACNNYRFPEGVKFMIEFGFSGIAPSKILSNSLFLSAIEHHDVEIAEMFLKYGAKACPSDLKIPEHAPLLHAVGFKKIDVVKLLIQHGADKLSICHCRKTALLDSIEKHHWDDVHIMIENGADVNFRITRETHTPLVAAIKNNSYNTVRMLLEHGAFLNIADPLHHAAELYNTDILELLLQFGAKVNIDHKIAESALMVAVYQKNFNAVKVLVQYGARVDVSEGDKNTLLMQVILTGDSIDLFEFLFNQGALTETNSAGDLLKFALRDKRKQIASFFIKQPVLIEEDNVLVELIEEGSFDEAHLFIELGGDVNFRVDSDEDTPLIAAIKQHNYPLVKFLLDHGAKVDVSGEDELFPVHVASEQVNSSILELLLKHGADANVFSGDNDTPLMIAARGSNLNCLKKLVDYGENVNEVDHNDSTALMFAIVGGDFVEGVDYLLQKGAEIDLTNNENETALLMAIDRGRHKIVKLLIENGADINLTLDEDFLSEPYLLAKKKGDKKIMNLLIQHGARVSEK